MRVSLTKPTPNTKYMYASQTITAKRISNMTAITNTATLLCQQLALVIYKSCATYTYNALVLAT